MTTPEPTQPLTWVDLDAIRDRSRGINNAAEAYDSAEDVPTLLAELDRLHSWNGLMALLDEHWPEDIFPTREDDTARDPGPRIISLLRWTIRLHAENTAQAAKLVAGRAVLTDRIAKWKAQQEVWQNMPTSAMGSSDWLNVEFEQHRLGEVEDLLDRFDAAVDLDQSGEGQTNG